MKYLITGGCGFLGSNLTAKVLKRAEESIIFDNLCRYGSYQNLDWLKSQGEFQFIHADIRNTNDVEKAVKNTKPDIIFHLAGQVAMTTSLKNPRLDFEVNVLGTFNLLEAVRKYTSDSILIYSSTNKLYGDLEYLTYEETKTRYICRDYLNGFDGELPLDFHFPYGCSKEAADQYVLDYVRMFGLKTVVLRHSSMYGGRQFATYDQGWIGWFCQKATEIKKGILKESLTISGDGKQVRDVLHASDVVRLYFKTLENIDKAKGEAFNSGGGMENSLSVIELFQILERELNVELRYKKLSWRISDQKVFVADTNKVKKLVSWQSKVDKNNGIRVMLDWLMDSYNLKEK